MPIIPNRNVGPQALRYLSRQPQPWPSLISAKLDTLTDDFSTQDAKKWVYGGGTSASGGVANLTTSGGQVDLRTVSGYNFTGSYAYAKVNIGPNLTSGDYFLFNLFPNWGDNNNRFGIEIDPAAGNILLYKNVGGVFSGSSALSYDATGHQWIRLRESGGTFFLDVSPDGANWTNGVRSLANPPFSITSCVFAIDYSHSANSNTATVDNLNIQADVSGYRPTVPSGWNTGPMVQRLQWRQRSLRVSSQQQGYTDGADTSVAFTTSDDGFVDRPGAKTSVVIPNKYVGPTALRQSKRQPYVSSQRQGYTDGANQTITVTTSDDGFIDHPGAQTSVVIPNKFVGPTALRQGKRQPYVSAQLQGYTDGANQVITITTSDDGSVDHPGAKTTVIIPNKFVGPMALRQSKHLPYVSYTAASGSQAFTDGANSTWTFTTSTDGRRGISDAANTTITFTTPTDGFIDHPGAKTSVLIPNRNVGPTALRQGKRQPYVPAQRQGYTDGADTSVTFTTSDDGFIDHPGAKTAVIIPNRMVGPVALRQAKHLPYVSSQRQGYTEGANTVIVVTATGDGFIDHPGAKTAVVIPNKFVGPTALRQIKRLPIVFTVTGPRAISDGADQTITFTTSTDGFLDHPGAKTAVVIPNKLVGPQALRRSKHQPYVATQRQGYLDGADRIIGFVFSEDGQVTAGNFQPDFITEVVHAADAFISVMKDQDFTTSVSPEHYITVVDPHDGFITVISPENRIYIVTKPY